MDVEVRRPAFRQIVGDDARLEQLASGFLFTEGPLWQAATRTLFFSDMPGDILRCWSATGGIRTFRQPSRQSNGLAWDRQGRLLACEHASSQVTRTESDGAITTLASHYEGKELNSPNDLVVHTDGSIYFTDPTYGRKEFFGVPRPVQLGHRGVYRIDGEHGGVRLLADDFDQPNGLCFSLDGSRLFVNDTARGHVRVFDVLANGDLGEGRVWAEPRGEGDGAPDGMKLDSAGNLYTCGPGGIHVFNPDAECLGVIRIPEVTANFTWGDDDMCSLFVTASTSVYRTRVRVPGRPALS